MASTRTTCPTAKCSLTNPLRRMDAITSIRERERFAARRTKSGKLPRGPRSSRGFALIALLLGLWSFAALAHDPGLSTVTARLDADALDVQVGFSARDFGQALTARRAGQPMSE